MAMMTIVVMMAGTYTDACRLGFILTLELLPILPLKLDQRDQLIRAWIGDDEK